MSLEYLDSLFLNSFLEILERTNCKVFAYDLSVDTVSAPDFRFLSTSLIFDFLQIGPEIMDAPQEIQDRTTFHRYGIAGLDAPYSSPVMYSLRTLMKQNGKKYTSFDENCFGANIFFG